MAECAALTVAFAAAFATLRAGSESDLGMPLLGVPLIIIATVHGFMPALLSAIMLGVWVFVGGHEGLGDAASLPGTASAAGMLLLVLFVAEFREREKRRLNLLQEELANLEQARERLEESNFALSRDNARLREDQKAKGTSVVDELRRSLEVARSSDGSSRNDFEQAANCFLSVLASHLRVRSAGVYLATSEGLHAGRPIASIGCLETLDPMHPKIAQCVREGEAVTVAESTPLAEGVQDDVILAAVPIRNSRGDLAAVLVIFDMPFADLRDETIRLIWAMSGQLVESEASPQDEPVTTASPSTFNQPVLEMR